MASWAPSASLPAVVAVEVVAANTSGAYSAARSTLTGWPRWSTARQVKPKRGSVTPRSSWETGGPPDPSKLSSPPLAPQDADDDAVEPVSRVDPRRADELWPLAVGDQENLLNEIVALRSLSIQATHQAPDEVGVFLVERPEPLEIEGFRRGRDIRAASCEKRIHLMR